jgi:hypothetical protein
VPRPQCAEAGCGPRAIGEKLCTLSRRRGMDSERVHAAGKLTRQCGVDHAVTLEPALPAKSFRHDIEPEMRLPAGPMSGVAFVAMRLVFHAEALQRVASVRRKLPRL